MIGMCRRYYPEASQAEKHCQINPGDKAEQKRPHREWFAGLKRAVEEIDMVVDAEKQRGYHDRKAICPQLRHAKEFSHNKHKNHHQIQPKEQLFIYPRTDTCDYAYKEVLEIRRSVEQSGLRYRRHGNMDARAEHIAYQNAKQYQRQRPCNALKRHWEKIGNQNLRLFIGGKLPHYQRNDNHNRCPDPCPVAVEAYLSQCRIYPRERYHHPGHLPHRQRKNIGIEHKKPNFIYHNEKKQVDKCVYRS